MSLPGALPPETLGGPHPSPLVDGTPLPKSTNLWPVRWSYPDYLAHRHDKPRPASRYPLPNRVLVLRRKSAPPFERRCPLPDGLPHSGTGGSSAATLRLPLARG